MEVRFGTPGQLVTDVVLEHRQGLEQLQVPALDRSQITDAGLVYLQGLTQLRTLDWGLTDVTATRLEHLQGSKQLQFLYLPGTKTSDEGARKLQEALPICKIQH